MYPRKIEPVRRRSAEDAFRVRRVRRAQGVDTRPDLFDLRHLRLFLGADSAVCLREISRLLDDRLHDGPRRAGHHDEAGNRRSGRSDPGHEHSAEAVAEHDNPVRIHARSAPEHLHRRDRVVDRFVLDGKTGQVAHQVRMHPRAFVVPQDGDPPRGESEREILELLDLPDGCIAVARS